MTETNINPSAEWEEKCWGRTRCVVNSPFYSRHELEVEAGGYCSFHYHRNRGNRFIVPRGSQAAVRVVQAFGWRLLIYPILADRPYSPLDVSLGGEKLVMTTSSRLDLPALVPHQFQVERGGKLIEEYWSDRHGEVEVDDIVRLSEGGKVSAGEMAAAGYDIGIFQTDGRRWYGREENAD